jgi:hypothetical protein
METEELLRSHPIDGAVLMGGCDKTTPGLLMGAISMGVPAIYVPAGPQLRGNWRGQQLGSGSDAWKYWDEKRAGRISDADWAELEGGISRSYGTCMVMGTAATMMAITEALGMSLPGASSIPAADSGHKRMCAAAGRRVVDLVWDDVTPQKILTPAAFDNAIRVHMAMGGSTNAIIHVVAMARRAGLKLDMSRFDEISREIPVLANVRPSGEFLMEDFFYAGGLRALMAELKSALDLSCLTVTGKSIGASLNATQDVGSMPINLALSPDGRYIVTTDAGYYESLWSIRTSDGRGVSASRRRRSTSSAAPRTVGSALLAACSKCWRAPAKSPCEPRAMPSPRCGLSREGSFSSASRYCSTAPRTFPRCSRTPIIWPRSRAPRNAARG